MIWLCSEVLTLRRSPFIHLAGFVHDPILHAGVSGPVDDTRSRLPVEEVQIVRS